MTALPPAPFTIKSALDFTDEADNHALIVLHFGYTGAAPTSGTLTTMATSIGTAWTSNFAPLYSTSGGLLTVVCTDLAASNGAQGSASPNVSGTRVGGGLPRSTAMLFNHHIAQRYRGGKGRTYMPLGVAGDITGGGNWVTSFTNSAQTAWGAFIASTISLTGAAVPLSGFVILSYYLHKALRATPIQYPVLSTTANTVPGTQRRRNWP